MIHRFENWNFGEKEISRWGRLISSTNKIGVETLLWAAEYELEIEMHYLKYGVNHWNGGRNKKGMSIMSYLLKEERKRIYHQMIIFLNVLKHNT